MTEPTPDTPIRSDMLLPEVEPGIVERFELDSPAFEMMFTAMKRDNKELARWLIRNVHKSAVTMQEKERYATTALQLYTLLSTQAIIDGNRRAYHSHQQQTPPSTSPTAES